ncbi:MAG: hypothetical protein AAFV29_17090, partial [Myxococcota bacterium]
MLDDGLEEPERRGSIFDGLLREAQQEGKRTGEVKDLFHTLLERALIVDDGGVKVLPEDTMPLQEWFRATGPGSLEAFSSTDPADDPTGELEPRVRANLEYLDEVTAQLVDGMTPADKARFLAGKTPEEAARILAAGGRQRASRILDDLAATGQASLAASILAAMESREEAAEIAKRMTVVGAARTFEAMDAEVAEEILGFMTPAEAAAILSAGSQQLIADVFEASDEGSYARNFEIATQLSNNSHTATAAAATAAAATGGGQGEFADVDPNAGLLTEEEVDAIEARGLLAGSSFPGGYITGPSQRLPNGSTALIANVNGGAAGVADGHRRIVPVDILRDETPLTTYYAAVDDQGEVIPDFLVAYLPADGTDPEGWYAIPVPAEFSDPNGQFTDYTVVPDTTEIIHGGPNVSDAQLVQLYLSEVRHTYAVQSPTTTGIHVSDLPSTFIGVEDLYEERLDNDEVDLPANPLVDLRGILGQYNPADTN